MKAVIGVFGISLLIHLAAAPPPRRNEVNHHKQESSQENNEIEDFGLEYNRYLKEVIDLLESDPEFKKKLEEAQEIDIRNGQIAKELEFVDHKVRTKLDEVKRQEIERLRHLALKQSELNDGIDVAHAKVSAEHLDDENPHTFEMEDLKKLIAKVSLDLKEADIKRRQEFKEYEMQKEFEKQQKLQHLQGSEREAFEKQLKENETKHKQHEPLHEPGSKQQLEEVWEKQDHMENQEFDPKVFFQLHDLDGNRHWDHNEVKALFLKELDKMYEAGAPEVDMKERMEEMERMREHVFNEADKNKDGLISYEEFLDKTKQPDFEKDPGWETLDQKPVYTHEEYLEFEKRRQQEVQKMIQQGLIPPQPVFHAGDGYHAPYYQYHPQQFQAYAGGQVVPDQQHPHASNFNQPPYAGHQVPSNQHQMHPQQHVPSQIVQQPVHPNQGTHDQLQNKQTQPNFESNQPSQGKNNASPHIQNGMSAANQQNQYQQQEFNNPLPNRPSQGYQQPQQYQPVQSQPNQMHQVPLNNVNQPSVQSTVHPSKGQPNVGFNNKPVEIRQGHDPNAILPDSPQFKTVYSKKDEANVHVKITDSQYKVNQAQQHVKF